MTHFKATIKTFLRSHLFLASVGRLWVSAFTFTPAVIPVVSGLDEIAQRSNTDCLVRCVL